MLGRHHISVSIGTVTPFLIPLIFFNSSNLIPFALAFLFAVFVGSLTPDADCGGNPTLYYRVQAVDWLMKNVIMKPVVLAFQRFAPEYKVTEEHRGIMHSPIGVTISSFLLTLILAIVLIIIHNLNFIFILIVFLGLILGQFLHLLEDSMTKSGIEWGFPFINNDGKKDADKKGWINGEIITGENKDMIDIRPMMYQYTLILFSIVIAVVYILKTSSNSPINPWISYPIMLIIVIVLWLIFYRIAKDKNKDRWYKEKEKVKCFRKFIKRITG